MTEFAENAGGMLLQYLHEQKAKVQRIESGEIYDKDDPRFDICLRHEADKLKMLHEIIRDAGYTGSL